MALLGLVAAGALGPTAFGAYSAAYAFVTVFRILPDMGMAYASTLEISRDKSRAGVLVGNLLAFQAVLAAATFALCLASGFLLFGRAGEGVVFLCVVLLACDLVLKTAKGTLRYLLKGLQRFDVEAVSLLCERSALLLLGVLALRRGFSAVGFVAVFLVVRVPDLLGLWTYTSTKLVPLRPARDLSLWRDLLVKGIPLAYAGVMLTLLFQVDQVLLDKLRGTTEVGYYSVSIRVLEGLALVPRVIGYALLPTMAALHPGSPQALTAVYRRGCRTLLLLGLPVAVFGAMAAAPFLELVFGREYAPGAAAAAVVIPTALFLFLSNFSETTLACIDRSRTLVLTTTLALVLDAGLCLVLIPSYGALGAAWARFAAEGFYLLLSAGFVIRYGHDPSWLRLAVRPLLCALAFGVVLHLSLPQGLVVAAALASLAWAAAAGLLRAWREPS